MDNARAKEQSITKDYTDGLMSFNHTFLESLPRFFHFLFISGDQSQESVVYVLSPVQPTVFFSQDDCPQSSLDFLSAEACDVLFFFFQFDLRDATHCLLQCLRCTPCQEC